VKIFAKKFLARLYSSRHVERLTSSSSETLSYHAITHLYLPDCEVITNSKRDVRVLCEFTRIRVVAVAVPKNVTRD
jgi:hypothetical protein